MRTGTDGAPKPERTRRFRPNFLHDETQELTGCRTSVELLQTDLSQWTWTDFVALCDINKAVWTTRDVCVCYTDKDMFPPQKHKHRCSEFIVSVPDSCNEPYFCQHLHIFVRHENETELLETIQGMMHMVARSTTRWIGLGTHQGAEQERKALPLTPEALQTMLRLSYGDSMHAKEVVFWNVSVSTEQYSVVQPLKSQILDVKFQACDFANGVDAPIKKEAEKCPKTTTEATTKLHLKRHRKLTFVTACFLLLTLYLLWLFVSGNSSNLMVNRHSKVTV